MTKNRYIVLVSGMLIQFCAGIIYMWSVFKNPVAEHLSWNADAAAFTSSIMLAAFVLGILFGGRLQDKYGPRPITAAGGILISAGMLATAFVPVSVPWLIYITYGAFAGFGVGFVYTCTVSTVQKWFPDKRGFATGMIVSAFGLSLVAFAPLARCFLAELGVPVTFIIFAAAFFVICVPCSFFVRNPQNIGAAKAGSAGGQKQFKTSEMLKTKIFYLLAGSMFFLLPAYFILNPLLITLGTGRGLTEDTALFGVMITGIASAAGRLVVSWVSDKTGRKKAVLGIAVLTILSVLIMTVAQGVMFLVCVALIAFAFGGSSGVYAAFTAENFGTKYAGTNFGCVMLAFGLSALLSPAISNVIAADGDYTFSFILAAATSLVAFVLVLFIKKPAVAEE